MPKKGQVVLFLIIGFTLLIVAGITIYFRFASTDESAVSRIQYFPQSIVPIKKYIEACLEKTIKDGILSIGMQGGYYQTPKPYIDFSPNYIPYYYINKHNSIPSKKTVENEISKYIFDMLQYCIDFRIFKEQNYNIGGVIKNISVFVSDDIVSATLDYPLIISKDSLSFELNKIGQPVPSRLGIIIKLSEKITENSYESICINCVYNDSIRFNLSIEIFAIVNSTLVFQIKDNQSSKGSKDLIFRFALQIQENNSYNPDYKDLFPDQKAEVGYLFTYIPSIKQNVEYKAYTNLFSIEQHTGLINFTPALEDIGMHLIPIDIYDNSGHVSKKLLFLNITFFNSPPVLSYLGYQTAQANKLFSYKVQAYDKDDNDLYFIDDGDLFNISFRSGLINFTPKDKDVGVHELNVTVIDSNGGRDTEKIVLIIGKNYG